MKLNEEQLNSLQDLLSKKNNLMLSIGELESNKHVMLHNLSNIELSIKEFTDELREEYGDVEIDVNTGEIWKSEKSQ